MEHMKWQNFIFIQNAHLLLQRKCLISPRNPQIDQILYLFKTPPSHHKNRVYFHRRAANFVFIKNAPLLLQKKQYQILYLFKTPLSDFRKSGNCPPPRLERGLSGITAPPIKVVECPTPQARDHSTSPTIFYSGGGRGCSTPSIYRGGGRYTPLFQSHTVFDCFYNWNWTNIVFLQNTTLQFPKKAVATTKG